MLCVEKQVTEYGQFLGFDTLTLVPFDVDAIDVNIMSDYEIRLLRQYHKLVYKRFLHILILRNRNGYTKYVWKFKYIFV